MINFTKLLSRLHHYAPIPRFTPEEKRAHLIFAFCGIAGAAEFQSLMNDKQKESKMATSLYLFYGACNGSAIGIFASGVLQISPPVVGAIGAAILARRAYICNSESKSRG